MRRIFADAVYRAAVANRKDQWHAKVVTVIRSLGQAALITTEDVLGEFLARYTSRGPFLRNLAAATVEKTLANPHMTVLPQSHHTFVDGVAFYKACPDKSYSLADCISMQAMRQQAITEILTHDNHFAQEGFPSYSKCRLVRWPMSLPLLSGED